MLYSGAYFKTSHVLVPSTQFVFTLCFARIAEPLVIKPRVRVRVNPNPNPIKLKHGTS